MCISLSFFTLQRRWPKSSSSRQRGGAKPQQKRMDTTYSPFAFQHIKKANICHVTSLVYGKIPVQLKILHSYDFSLSSLKKMYTTSNQDNKSFPNSFKACHQLGQDVDWENMWNVKGDKKPYSAETHCLVEQEVCHQKVSV